jgi:hypothetical protein
LLAVEDDFDDDEEWPDDTAADQWPIDEIGEPFDPETLQLPFEDDYEDQ